MKEADRIFSSFEGLRHQWIFVFTSFFHFFVPLFYLYCFLFFSIKVFKNILSTFIFGLHYVAICLLKPSPLSFPRKRDGEACWF